MRVSIITFEERNEIFTAQDVVKIYKEYGSYTSMWNTALDDYIHFNVVEPAKQVLFEEWFQFYLEGWSNDEIISGIQTHSIEE